MKPYFLPLKGEYYLKIKTGKQNCEIRPNNHRGWNIRNIFPGRILRLSYGYGKGNRMLKEITKTVVNIGPLLPDNVPQWHIDAVEEIYGKQAEWLIAYI